LPPPVSVPTLVEAILAGNQPANLTVKRLPDLPLEWSKQHSFLVVD
jgi:hypothetical protein